jgi:hypothetical protein
MTTSQEPNFSSNDSLAHPHAATRSPRRITISVPYQLYQRLGERSDREGRSLSNLAAFLLERCFYDYVDG